MSLIRYHRLRAPTEHGAALVEPAWEVAAASLMENRRRVSMCRLNLCGRDWSTLARAARQQLCGEDVTAPIILTGHQPQLYHPGVWFKNFALDHLAKRTGARAVNLLIDNDAIRSPTIRVPTGSLAEPRVESLAFDAAAPEMPLEERTILDRQLWNSFGQRVTSTLAPLVHNPLIATWWPEVIAASAATSNIGQAISAARHQLESRWGLSTREVPLSAVCDSEPFRLFLLALLYDARHFADIYNAALAEYRHVHKLRGASHPVPDLRIDEQDCETPFWIWTAADPRRRRLFVRQLPDGLELADHEQWRLVLPATPSRSPDAALQALSAARAAQVKIRPRALATTLFARLLLCDLFLHGIGGAKYDQVTDAIFVRYFQIEPPLFSTITATLTLPIAPLPSSWDDHRAARQQLRAMRFHPERFLRSPLDDTATALVAEKRRWLAVAAPRGARRDRHRAIQQINAALQSQLAEPRAALERQLADIAREAPRRELLASREFSFCLFPEEKLRHTLLALCQSQS